MQEVNTRDKREREAIHSGHFMVSHFEAEEQDDEDDVAVPVPETEVKNSLENIPDQFNLALNTGCQDNGKTNQQLSIETNLSKLFQCMSIAYRQKLTSPKWNRFRGIKLRWKDKIRLNNVIWRCWHMQFIMKQPTLICQFASPLDVDTHNKPEAIVLEGKYWKRKLHAVTAEYKKWRLFYRNQSLGGSSLKDPIMTYFQMAEREALDWNSQSNDGLHMMVDEDYMDFMSDTLFSTITNQPFVFPDSREIAKAGLADFIQPSLGPLQPNLDDFMDTFEPDLIISKLPSVPEEQGAVNPYKPIAWDYSDLDMTSMQPLSAPQQISEQYQNLTTDKISQYNNELILGLPNPEPSYIQQSQAQHSSMPSYTTVISKSNSNKISKKNIQNYKQGINYSNFTLTPIKQDTVLISVPGPSSSAPQQQNLNSSGYKFPAPVQPNLKFSNQNIVNEYMVQQGQIMNTSRQEVTHMKKDIETGIMKPEMGDVSRNKLVHHRRQRSRSSSRDPTSTQQRPPLMTAMSDPALLTSGTSVLLTQLLTSNSHLAPPTSTANKQQPTNSVVVKREDSGSSYPVTILPAPPPPVTTLIITTSTHQPTSTSDQILLNSMSAPCRSPVLDHSSRSQDSPDSPLNSRSMIGSPGSKGESPPHGDHKRIGHIHAEQKRRYNIKTGFDMLHSLIPHLNQNPNTKLSKAAMLQKGADYIRQLRSERNQLREEMDSLRQQIDCLNTSISNCQLMMPPSGLSVPRRRDNKMQELFDEYVRNRTGENWKFWIFSLMIKPLLESYSNLVSTSNLEELYGTTIRWVEQHCTLVDLRPVVLNSLRYLSTKTEILTEPDKLPQEARQAAMNTKPVYP